MATTRIVMNLDGSIIDKINGHIVANNQYAHKIQVISPFPSSDSVSLEWYLRNARITTYSQYIGLLKDDSGNPILAGALVDSNKVYYQTVKEWYVWQVAIDSKALAAISRYHAGKVDLTVKIKEFRNLYVDEAITNKGSFGSRKSTTGGDLPSTANEGDYYVCDFLDYYSVETQEDYTLSDYAYYTNGAWLKGVAYLFRLSSSSLTLSVDPSVFGQDIESVSANTGELLASKIAGLEAVVLGQLPEDYANNLFIRKEIDLNYNEKAVPLPTDVLYIERNREGFNTPISEIVKGLPEVNAAIIKTTDVIDETTGDGLYADKDNIVIGSATGDGISWSKTEGLFFRGTIQAGTITDQDLIDSLKGEDGYTPILGVDYYNGEDGYTPVFGEDYFNGVAGTSFKYIGVLSFLADLALISNPSENDAYRITETNELWVYNGSIWLNMGQIQGEPGTDGTNGLSTYLHIAYSTAVDGSTGFHISNSVGKTYIGQYSDFSIADSTTYTDYSWSLIKGADGSDGSDGVDGDNAYLHLAYANSANGETDFNTTYQGTEIYMGTYTNNIETDSETYTDYDWFKVVGTNGSDGADGDQLYFHIAYAETSNGDTGFSTTDPTDAFYIGTYTDTIVEDSTSPSSYTWALFAGTDGQDGSDGTSVVLKGSVDTVGDLPSGATVGDLYVVLADGDGYVWNGSTWDNVGQIQGPDGEQGEPGSNAYVHFAYSTSSDGQDNFSVTTFVGALYIGQYTDFTITDSTIYTYYTWTLFAGTDGADGSDGDNGLTAYIHYAYATTSNGDTGFSLTYTGSEDYIGYLTDFTIGDSTDFLDYEWSLFKGSNGLDGDNGENGLPSYLHYAYATSDDGSVGFSTTYTGLEGYIGFYTDFTLEDSVNYTDYEWALFKGDDGLDGDDGSDAQYLNVSGKLAFKFLKDSATPTYTSIEYTAELFGISPAVYQWQYHNGTIWTDFTSNTSSTFSLEYNNAAWTDTTLRVRCLSTNVFDEITVSKLYDGNTGINAVSGQLTDENVTVPTDYNGDGYDTLGFSGTFEVFYGLTDVTTSSTFEVTTATVDNLTLSIGAATGIYTLETDDDTWSANYTEFELKATYGDAIITKKFKISKARAGTNGTNGTNGTDGNTGPGLLFRGVWVTNTNYYYDLIRQDIVEYPEDSQTYYTVKVQGTLNKTTFSTSDWTIMTSFASVATDILLAQNATITKGLVMGTASTTVEPFIRSYAKTALNSGNGFYLSGDGKFNFGNTTKNIDWDGTDLTVKGDIVADSLTINDDLTVTNDIILGTGGQLHSLNMDSLTDGTGGVFIQSDGKFIFGKPSTNSIGWNGTDLTIKGNLSGSTGTFGTVGAARTELSSTGIKIYSANNKEILSSDKILQTASLSDYYADTTPGTTYYHAIAGELTIPISSTIVAIEYYSAVDYINDQSGSIISGDTCYYQIQVSISDGTYTTTETGAIGIPTSQTNEDTGGSSTIQLEDDSGIQKGKKLEFRIYYYSLSTDSDIAEQVFTNRITIQYTNDVLEY